MLTGVMSNVMQPIHKARNKVIRHEHLVGGSPEQQVTRQT